MKGYEQGHIKQEVMSRFGRSGSTNYTENDSQEDSKRAAELAELKNQLQNLTPEEKMQLYRQNQEAKRAQTEQALEGGKSKLELFNENRRKRQEELFKKTETANLSQTEKYQLYKENQAKNAAKESAPDNQGKSRLEIYQENLRKKKERSRSKDNGLEL